MNNTTIFAPASTGLEPATLNQHHAIISLKEELDAIDWYAQRAEQCTDPELRAILVHNKDEEIEHAVMLLEWLRRTSPVFDANVRKYLFSSGSITLAESGAEIEANETGRRPALATAAAAGTLGIGSLKSATWTS